MDTRLQLVEKHVRSQSGDNLVMASDFVDTRDNHWTTPPDDKYLIMEPFIDGLPVKAFKSVEPDGETSCYNWARSNLVDIDPTKTYEFSIWIKSKNHVTGMNGYFGYHIFDKDGTRIESAPHANPYFKGTEGDGDDWVKHYGFLVGSDFNDASYTYKVKHSNMFYINHKDATKAYVLLVSGGGF